MLPRYSPRECGMAAKCTCNSLGDRYARFLWACSALHLLLSLHVYHSNLVCCVQHAWHSWWEVLIACCWAVLCCAAPCCAMLGHAALRYAALCCAVLCCAVLPAGLSLTVTELNALADVCPCVQAALCQHSCALVFRGICPQIRSAKPFYVECTIHCCALYKADSVQQLWSVLLVPCTWLDDLGWMILAG